MWLRKRGDGSFGDHMSRERICSDYVGRRRGDSLTMSCREEVMENDSFRAR